MNIVDNSKKRGNQTLKAASWYTISNFLSKVILYLYTPLFARLLTTWEYGQYGNFTSWQTILVSLLSLNLYSTVAIAYLDFDNEHKFREFISTISILGILPSLVFLILSFAMRETFEILLGMSGFLVLMLATYVTFSSTLTVFQAEQRSRVQYKLSSFLTLLSSVGSAALIAIFLAVFNNKLDGVIVGSVVGVIVINICILLYLLHRQFTFKLEYAKYALVIALPLIPHVLAGHILGSADKIMISKLCGSEYTAFYNIPFTVSMVITLLTTSVNNAWVPWFFKRMKNGDIDQIKKVIRITVPIFIGATFCLCFFAPEIILIVGGNKYIDSVYIMPPIILSCFFNYLYTLYVNIEFYHKKTLGISVATVISALVNILLNYIFIKAFGYTAAAYTTLFSSILTLIIHILIVNKRGWNGLLENKYIIIMALGCTVICLLTVALYKNNLIRWIGEGITVAIIVYVIMKYRKTIISYFRGGLHE